MNLALNAKQRCEHNSSREERKRRNERHNHYRSDYTKYQRNCLRFNTSLWPNLRCTHFIIHSHVLNEFGAQTSKCIRLTNAILFYLFFVGREVRWKKHNRISLWSIPWWWSVKLGCLCCQALYYLYTLWFIQISFSVSFKNPVKPRSIVNLGNFHKSIISRNVSIVWCRYHSRKVHSTSWQQINGSCMKENSMFFFHNLFLFLCNPSPNIWVIVCSMQWIVFVVICGQLMNMCFVTQNSKLCKTIKSESWLIKCFKLWIGRTGNKHHFKYMDHLWNMHNFVKSFPNSARCN